MLMRPVGKRASKGQPIGSRNLGGVAGRVYVSSKNVVAAFRLSVSSREDEVGKLRALGCFLPRARESQKSGSVRNGCVGGTAGAKIRGNAHPESCWICYPPTASKTIYRSRVFQRQCDQRVAGLVICDAFLVAGSHYPVFLLETRSRILPSYFCGSPKREIGCGSYSRIPLTGHYVQLWTGVFQP